MRAVAITPTNGRRPALLDKCKGYVSHQNIRIPHYVVAKDRDVLGNMRELCDLFESSGADIAVIFEDDDWYPYDWVERVLEAFDENPQAIAVGVERSIYYHVPSRSYWPRDHEGRSALNATAFGRAALSVMRRAIPYYGTADKKRPLLDLRFWGDLTDDEKAFVDDGSFPVGIKGLEPGHTIQHDRLPDRGQWIEDQDATRLRMLIGDDADFYLGY